MSLETDDANTAENAGTTAAAFDRDLGAARPIFGEKKVYNPPPMRRLLHIFLAAAFLVAALAEPVAALQATHACCLKPAAVAAEKPSCHSHRGTPAASVSESHSAHSDCPSRCCLGLAPQTARPESPQTSAAALHSVAGARVSSFQFLSEAELPAHSGRAPPSLLDC
jgi:hypothetical protein